jgi:hypothetical protein
MVHGGVFPIGQALKRLDDLAGFRSTVEPLLGKQGQAPISDSSTRPRSAPQPATALIRPDSSPSGGGSQASGAAGSGPSGGGGALFALLIALIASVGLLWGRLQLVPVRWRSVAIVALVERPG